MADNQFGKIKILIIKVDEYQYVMCRVDSKNKQ
jgi:hypothetical protein